MINFVAFAETNYFEQRYVQIWIIAKSWKPNPVGGFLDSLQQN